MSRHKRAVARLMEIREKILEVEHLRNEHISYLQALTKKLVTREITREQYHELANKKHGERSSGEWIEFYDSYLNIANKVIYKEEKSLVNKKIILSFTSVIFGLFILGILIFSSGINLTGFTIGDFSGDNEKSEAVSIKFSDNGEYIWNLESEGKINSFAVSGKFSGEGRARVYLNDFLVLDSVELVKNNQRDNSQSAINGNPLSELNALEFKGENLNETKKATAENEIIRESIINPEQPVEFVVSFEKICVDTCDLNEYNLNSEEYKIRVEIENGEIEIEKIIYSVGALEELNETSDNSILTEQGSAIIGVPVYWKKTINFDGPASLEVELPENYYDENVEKINSGDSNSGDARNVRVTKEDIIIENGYSKSNGNFYNLEMFDSESGAIISYKTPAPKTEERYEKGKKIINLFANTNIAYKNILLNTTLNYSLKVSDSSKVRIYWVENQTELPIEKIEDRDNDSFYDYLEWVAPIGNNQTFVIIVITSAEHLDVNRDFISDIYNEVKELDGKWSEPIQDGEYARATFKSNLTNLNDITIYPRIISGNPRIEIYEKNLDVVIARFDSISENQYNKVYLSNLGERTQDTFDLKILGGSVEFDHIIDPPSIGRVTLYLNNTASGGSCPTVHNSLGTGVPASVVSILPGEFDSTLPGNTDAGQWQPGINPIANTTAATEIFNVSDTTVFNGLSLGRGWIWNDNLTGYRIAAGNYTFNLSVMGGQGANTLNERIFARIVVVSCSGGQFTLVKNLTTTNCVGCGSNTLGQTSWRANGEGRVTHPAVNAIASKQVNITASEEHDFSEGEYLFIELGFGDGDTTGDRTTILRYNQGLSFVITPAFSQTDVSLPKAILNAPGNGSTSTSISPTFNATFTDNIALKNATLYVYNSTQSLINNSETRGITGTSNFTNVSVILPYPGIFFWNYLVCDNSSNCAFNNTNLTITYSPPDIFPPAISFVTPSENNNSLYSRKNIMINVSASDEVSLANITIYLFNSSHSLINSSNVSTSTNFANFTGLAGGVYYINSSAFDSSNNGNYTETRIIRIFDNIAEPGADVDLVAQACNGENEVLSSNNYPDSCTGSYPSASCGAGADLISCDDSQTENANINTDKYGGINVSYFNDQIVDCAGITSVQICYEWWETSGSPGMCVIAVDADGGASYSNVTTTCPGSTPDPGVACIDVTYYEQWTCGNFFGSTGTRAFARNELFRSNNGPQRVVSTDVFFFNITYATTVGDKTLPRVRLLNPANNTLTNNGVRFFVANFSDNVNVSNSTLYVWNSTSVVGTNFTNVGVQSAIVNLSFTFPRDGFYFWNYLAIDNSTNQNWNATNRSITFDGTGPIIDYVSPTEEDGANLSRNNVVINISSSDALVGLANISVRLFNSSHDLINLSNSTVSPIFVNFTELSSGIYYFNASVYDNLTNVNHTLTRTVNLTIVASNIPPNITFISPLSATDPTEATFTSVSINFTAFDLDGATNLNDTSAAINFTFGLGGEALRQNTTCMKQGASFGTYYQNYTCVVPIWYYDAAGTWNISAFIKDADNVTAQNLTSSFSYNQLSAFVASPLSLSFTSPNPGATNVTASNDPIQINNTGNKNITEGNLQINATDLIGESDSSKRIFANNFTVAILTGSTKECNVATNQTTVLNATEFQSVFNGTLARGNYSVNNGLTGQRNLYFCIREIGSELTSQSYSTASQGSWTIKILIGAFIIRRRKRKDMKNDRLIGAVKLIADELKEKYSMSKEETFTLIVDELKEKYSLTKSEVSRIIREETKKNLEIPLSIFSDSLGALESVCKYLHENEGMKYSEIARAINRDDRTVWTACNKAKNKSDKRFVTDDSSDSIPLSVMNNEKLTVLESIITYLKERGLSYKEIGNLLGRDQRNVWTIYSNAVRKN